MIEGVEGIAGRETEGVFARSEGGCMRSAGRAAVADGPGDADDGFVLDRGSIGSLIFDFWNISA